MTAGAGMADVARASLARLGLLQPGAVPPVVPLTGGVSSDIVRVDLPGRPVCVKRALARLRVAQEWRAPVARNAAEYRWIETVAAILPGAVPPLLGRDPGADLFVMAYLPADTHPVWKARLLAGDVDPGFAARVGDAIGRIHAATAGDPAIRDAFPNQATFHEIRIAPYLLATAERVPDHAAALQALAEVTAREQRALIHGDVSPKNILAPAAGPVFLDAECATWGDPAFDVAFCLNHLLLKAIHLPAHEAALLAAFRALVGAYAPHVAWEPWPGLDRRIARLLPGLFLARVDGKSPVEYLAGPDAVARVRRIAGAALADPPESLDHLLRRFREQTA